MPEEMLDILDAQDNITGKCTRSEKIKLGAITRNAVVFIIDNDGKLLLSKRSLDKKFYPENSTPQQWAML
jgi:isopentenyldiphosphate isomerase